MNYSEIGSEFWENVNSDNNQSERENLNFHKRKKGFLCGRTALDYIIKDAKDEVGLESVLLPSYCCDSMIEPFVRNHIKIRFYPVTAGEKGFVRILPEPKKHEALYLMPYFGFEALDVYDQEQISQWEFCISDETHSCFMKNSIFYEDWNIKYTFKSYRKWANVRGLAIASKTNSDFQVLYKYKDENSKYSEIIREACNRKKRYIEKNEGNKGEFLQLYGVAEGMLESDYTGYAFLPEGASAYRMLDIQYLQKKRRENAEYLLKRLGQIKDIDMLFPGLKEKDCPLFVPILLNEDMRDNLRKYLIDHNIYCPVHWPVSEYHHLTERERKIYKQELSVICDQRYGLSDMQNIVKNIVNFFEKQVSG